MFARCCVLLVAPALACAVPPVDGDGSSSGSTEVVRTTGDAEGSSTGSGDGSSSTSSGAAEGTSGGEASTSNSGTTGEVDSSSSGEATSGSSSTGAADPCGNGQVDDGEVCDDGKNDGDYGGCEADCSAPGPRCGDAEVNGPEECDDGNDLDGDGCDNDCTASWWEHEGVAYDVKISKLKGWTKCWEYSGTESIQSAISYCDAGEHLLVACAPMGEMQTLTMAAHGPRAAVTAGGSLKNPMIVNGAQWVYGASFFGASAIGVDMETSEDMMVFELNNYAIAGLSYCGDYGIFRRMMFQR